MERRTKTKPWATNKLVQQTQSELPTFLSLLIFFVCLKISQFIVYSLLWMFHIVFLMNFHFFLYISHMKPNFQSQNHICDQKHWYYALIAPEIANKKTTTNFLCIRYKGWTKTTNYSPFECIPKNIRRKKKHSPFVTVTPIWQIDRNVYYNIDDTILWWTLHVFYSHSVTQARIEHES